ncbi:MAG: hypothetical protein IJS65_07645 [Clostridia bacterium]|nr:hypothetical protein [Clostridia bacterium]
MTAFTSLSALARALFSLWALLLCLACITDILHAAVKKRFLFAFFALLLFAPVYFAWQVIFDFSLFGNGENAAALTRRLCVLPWIWWFAALVFFTVGAAFLLGLIVRYENRHITLGAIKTFLDRIPCGVCCWRDNGRVLFSNVCMNGLCLSVTSSPLLNGESFHAAVKDGIIPVSGKMWRFSCRDILSGGEKLHEMTAADVTTEYEKTQALIKDKADLAKLNQELRDYYLSIDDAVRRQEILQAKVNIHDEMNNLILKSTAANCEDAAALDNIFSLWEKNALLLCMEAEETADEKASSSLEQLAEALKIRLIWQGALPASLSEKQRDLFFSAAKEAVINAVKHASAKTLTVSFEETENCLFCRFSNDGALPPWTFKFTGGLLNLSVLAGKQGAALSADTDKEFILTLRFPKNA